MPSSRKVRLSPNAEDDLADILQFTAERWGEEQASTYKSALFRTLRRLADFPSLGLARMIFDPATEAIASSSMSFSIGSNAVRFESRASFMFGVILPRAFRGDPLI